MQRKIAIALVVILFAFAIFPKNIFAWSAADPPISYSLFANTSQYPYQMTIDSSGNLYVAITGLNKVSKYTSGGTLVTSFGTAFSGPTGVAIASNGNILVANNQQNKIEIYDSNGNFISSFGSTGAGNNQFNSPYAIAVDSSGNIFVADAVNNRVQKFDSSFTYLSTITGNGGAFSGPEVVSIDGSNNLFVLDSGNNRVQEFDSSGAFVRTITGNGGAWNFPEGMTVDSSGNLYVADSGNNRIQVFDSDGNFKQQFGSSGTALGQLQYAVGMAVNSSGVMYIGDKNRIQKVIFDRSPAVITINGLPSTITSNSSPVITGTATDAISALTSIQFSVDNGTLQNCRASDGTIDSLSENFICDVNSNLSIGSHTITIQATDSHTNTNSGGNLGTYSFTVTAAPAAPPVSSCTQSAPSSAPLISDIQRTDNSAILTYSPVSNSDNYAIEYGKTDIGQYALSFSNSSSTPNQTYKINSLEINADYYFRIRGGNGCSTGPWSAWKLSHGNSVIQSIPLPVSSPTPEPQIIPTGQPVNPTSTPPIENIFLNSKTPFPSSPPAVSKKLTDYIDVPKTVKTAEYVGVVAVPTVAATNLAVVAIGSFSSLFYVYKNTKRSIFKFPVDFIGALATLPRMFIKRNSSGIVFDSISNTPISGALILFFSESGNLKTTYSNRDGKYEIKLNPDDYKIRVDKEKYLFPSKFYPNPEKIPVSSNNQIVNNISVALDPTNKFRPYFVSFSLRFALYTVVAYSIAQLVKPIIF